MKLVGRAGLHALSSLSLSVSLSHTHTTHARAHSTVSDAAIGLAPETVGPRFQAALWFLLALPENVLWLY